MPLFLPAMVLPTFQEMKGCELWWELSFMSLRAGCRGAKAGIGVRGCI